MDFTLLDTIMAVNIIFAKRFESSARPVSAFGTNLLGAMVGGCLEYAALATGNRWLLVICACLYLAACRIIPRESDRRIALEARWERCADSARRRRHSRIAE